MRRLPEAAPCVESIRALEHLQELVKRGKAAQTDADDTGTDEPDDEIVEVPPRRRSQNAGDSTSPGSGGRAIVELALEKSPYKK
jgi:hypothetical protein